MQQQIKGLAAARPLVPGSCPSPDGGRIRPEPRVPGSRRRAWGFLKSQSLPDRWGTACIPPPASGREAGGLHQPLPSRQGGGRSRTVRQRGALSRPRPRDGHKGEAQSITLHCPTHTHTHSALSSQTDNTLTRTSPPKHAPLPGAAGDHITLHPTPTHAGVGGEPPHAAVTQADGQNHIARCPPTTSPPHRHAHPGAAGGPHGIALRGMQDKSQTRTQTHTPLIT